MKDFFKNVFATVVGIALFFAIVGFFGIISIIGMLASGDSKPSVKDNSVLVLPLSGVIDERSGGDLLSEMMGEGNGSMGLDDILAAIKAAKENDNVKGIYICHPRSPARLQEERQMDCCLWRPIHAKRLLHQ